MVLMGMFVVFDPAAEMVSLNLGWAGSCVWWILFPVCYWVTPSRISLLWQYLCSFLMGDLIAVGYSGGNMFMMVGLFMFIFLNNFWGLFSYVFTSSAHLVFSLSIGLMLWLGVMQYGVVCSIGSFMAHLVPLGTPGSMVVFMCFVESVSILIRPITLSVRLAVNMMAGHVLLGLVGSYLVSLVWGGGVFGGVMMFIIQGGLLLLEMGVAMVQAYVFVLLVSMYTVEVY